ncbi:MAG: bifunctional demethylmenaquinone methyltransferase/2-methoxy-6-polyprenyl-1,4-benzoquinol methylase UbiE [Deltaproteobacteria bacterium]|jgi:demethylmenaquinone methyltransferase/2-methoxy-6-polyprenyl-1,4-benzoquinol methylase|nr:bifunctional demethylmenaquinone methyltransferase/2-methoxy-6-polyprenyl-1,4-benzoquinol methylase UbiE [Deltaproteobacteria bacterium]
MTDQHREAPGSGAMFDAVSPRYDLLNRVLSFGLDQSWRRAVVAALKLGPEAAVLDLATGTGDLAVALAKQEANVVGLDPSRGMLAGCRRKLGAAGVGARVTLVQGDAQSLPFEDQRFDAVTMAFGIRNVPDRGRALTEARRVLKPGGQMAVLELTEPRGRLLGRLARFHVGVLVPRLGSLLSSPRAYRYLPKSIARFPSPEAFADEVQGAGFFPPTRRPFAFGACHLFLAANPS